MPLREVATAVGMSERRLRDLLTGRARPHRKTEEALSRAAVEFAREGLQAEGWSEPSDGLAACAAFLATQ